MSEQSKEEQALELVQKAKDAMPQEEMARFPEGVNLAVRELIRAVEVLLTPHHLLHLDLDPSLKGLFEKTGSLDIEELATRIQRAGETRFIVSFPEVELAVTDIWPDGTPPDDPTAEDVARVMRGESVNQVIRDWNLVDELSIRRSDQTDEIVFDGS